MIVLPQPYASVMGRSRRRRNRLLWILPPAVFLFSAEATFIAGCFHARASEIPVIVEPARQAAFKEARLGLRVDIQASGLRVTWNPETSVVQSATEAILQIDEALQHRDVHLDPAQIRDGSILYRPASDDITFRLELRFPVSSAMSQTVRVVGVSKTQADIDKGAEASPRKRKIVTPPAKQSWHLPESATMTTRAQRTAQIATLQCPPDIGLESVQNAGSLPFPPDGALPEYSTPGRRTKFFTTTIKHFGSFIKEARKKESFDSE